MNDRIERWDRWDTRLPNQKDYQSIPVIADFKSDDGSDVLKETIEANYKSIKQEILSLVESETERIKANPKLSHLIP